MKSFSTNLKHLRKIIQPKATQEKMAELLGVSISTYGSYEEGRAEPKLENLQKLTNFFGVTIEKLLNEDLSFQSSAQKPSNSAGRRPTILATTIDLHGKDNIEWVAQKAAAGYTTGYSDLEFVQKLPVFQVPFLDANKKYRAFTIQGDSMLPIPSGSMIFAEYMDDWSLIKDDTACIVVTDTDGIVFKKVFNYLKNQQCLLLVSSNPVFKPFLVGADDVLEVWRYAGFFTNQFLEA